MKSPRDSLRKMSCDPSDRESANIWFPKSLLQVSTCKRPSFQARISPTHEFPQTHPGPGHRDANRCNTHHRIRHLPLHGSHREQAKRNVDTSRSQYSNCFRVLDFLVQTCVEERTVLDCACGAVRLPYCGLYLCAPPNWTFSVNNLRRG